MALTTRVLCKMHSYFQLNATLSDTNQFQLKVSQHKTSLCRWTKSPATGWNSWQTTHWHRGRITKWKAATRHTHTHHFSQQTHTAYLQITVSLTVVLQWQTCLLVVHGRWMKLKVNVTVSMCILFSISSRQTVPRFQQSKANYNTLSIFRVSTVGCWVITRR